MGKGIASDVRNAILAAAREFEKMGAQIEEVSCPR
jgi:Asp-tRNA(Asn)/Glu-tRNA(Gln) amidotransferase A subunit family amidase